MRRLLRCGVLFALVCLVCTASVDLQQATARPDPLVIYTSDGHVLPAARLTDLGWPSLDASAALFTPPYVPPGLPVADDMPRPQVIVGSDGRMPVSNTFVYPYSAVVYIEFTRPDGGQGRCTGFFYAANAIATAAHCVYPRGGTSLYQWVRDVRVYPGRNDSTLAFGSCQVWRMAALGGWVIDGDANYDYAVLNPAGLGCRFKGSRTGWFGLSVLDDATLANYAVDTIGYPGDRGFGQWESDDGWVNPTTMLPKRIQHSADIWPGQSGAALAGGARTSCRTCAYAIQSTHSISMTENHATRIDGQALAFLRAMKMTETIYLPIIARSSYASPYPAP